MKLGLSAADKRLDWGSNGKILFLTKISMVNMEGHFSDKRVYLRVGLERASTSTNSEGFASSNLVVK